MHHRITILQFFLVSTLFFCQNLNSLASFPLIHHAERLFEENLFEDAALLYDTIIHQNIDSHPELKQSLLLRLAHCHLKMGDYQKAQAGLLNHIFLPLYEKEKNYLLALTYRHLGQYQMAIDRLQPLTSQEGDSLKEEINLELGINNYYLKQPSTSYFQSTAWNVSKPHLFLIAQTYLIRLNLQKNDFISAQHLIDQMKQHLTIGHPLNYEIAYLQGIIAFQTHQYALAIQLFENSLTPHNASACEWQLDTLYHITQSCLRSAEDEKLTQSELTALFSKAQQSIQAIPLNQRDEAFYLNLGELYFFQARRLNDPLAYEAAQQLFSQTHFFSTSKSRNQILLLQAASAPTYLERLHFYEQLTQDEQTPFYAQIWYQKGINDYEEGLKQKSKQDPAAQKILGQAAEAFQRAFELHKVNNPNQSAQALKSYILALQEKGTSPLHTWNILTHFIYHQGVEAAIKEPEELYYLAALIGTEILKNKNEVQSDEKQISPSLQEIEKLLVTGLEQTTNPKWSELFLKALGFTYFQENQFKKSDERWAQLIEQSPNSFSEACFWRAKCAEKLNDTQTMKKHLQSVYENDSQSTFAPMAYFNYYTYREYMHGSRKALKHLQAMPTYFPNHHLLILAYYLIGLDAKKDRLSSEGKLLHNKNLRAAIDAFQLAETTFDRLYKDYLIPDIELSSFTQIRYRSNLERALANFTIAKESEGAKKHIYMEYAIEVFKQIQDDFQAPLLLIATTLLKQNPFPEIWQESAFQLAQVYLEKKDHKEADHLLDLMSVQYDKYRIEHSYYLFQLWKEKGKLAQSQQKWETALDYFNRSEKAFQSLSPDEKLDLWIEQSCCYKEKGQLDEAMRLLSKVVNDEAISALRVKAMLLRAEIYALQDKTELALRQLEATSKKGGEWGKKAQQKLNDLKN